MQASQLRHGDVLCYVHGNQATLLQRVIRLVEGSQFVHAGVIVDVGYAKLVLEQPRDRQYSDLPFYRNDVGEQVFAFRPRFPLDPTCVDARIKTLINHTGYGWYGILDCGLNHLMGLITRGTWRKRVMLGHLKPNNFICSALVGYVLEVADRLHWVDDNRVLEPDDFANHPEAFDALGEVDWLS